MSQRLGPWLRRLAAYVDRDELAGKKDQQNIGSSGPDPNVFKPVVVTNPIKTEIVPDLDEQRADQKYRECQQSLFRDQIKAANRLNRITIAGIGVALATFVALICTIRVTNKTADATRASADAEVSSVRAWIDVFDWIPPLNPQDINKGIGLKLKNVGKTPGLRLSIAHEYIYLPKGSPIPRFTDCPNTEPTPIGNVLEPDNTPADVAPLPLKEPYNRDQINAFANFDSRIILHGCIRYDNVITTSGEAESLPGLTEFCSVFSARPNPHLTVGCGSGVRMK